MAAPSKNFSNISDGQVDADSPLDATLMTSIRDNLVHLKEWLGDSYTAAVDHDHDGRNSKPVAAVAPGSITTIELATGAVMGDNVDTSGAFESLNIGAGAAWTPAPSVKQLVSPGDNHFLEIYGGGTWRRAAVSCSGVHYFNGTNMRVYSTSGATDVYYHSF